MIVSGDAAPKISVVELRRNAPMYLDRQGVVAQTLLDNYDNFNIDAAPIRYLETLSVNDTRFRASINGHHALYQRSELADIDSFERDARTFFRVIESLVAPESYDRVGVLFSFPLDPSLSFDTWIRETLSPALDHSWDVDDGVLRLTRDGKEWNLIVTVRRWGAEDPMVDPAALRIDVDQYQLGVTKKAAWAVDVGALYRRATSTLSELFQKER